MLSKIVLLSFESFLAEIISPAAIGCLLSTELNRSKEKLLMISNKQTHFNLSFQLCLNIRKAKMGIIQQYKEMSAIK